MVHSYLSAVVQSAIREARSNVEDAEHIIEPSLEIRRQRNLIVRAFLRAKDALRATGQKTRNPDQENRLPGYFEQARIESKKLRRRKDIPSERAVDLH